MSVNSESHEFEMRPPNIQLIGSHEINFLHISNSSFVDPQINGLLIREGNVDLLHDDAKPPPHINWHQENKKDMNLPAYS